MESVIATRATYLPKSGLEQIEELLAQMLSAVSALLGFSRIVFDDPNPGNSDIVVIGWNGWRWCELPVDASPAVGKARKALRELRAYSSRAAMHASGQARVLREVEDFFDRLIEQPDDSAGAPTTSTDHAWRLAEQKAGEYRATLKALPTAFGDGERLLVSDTSALLDHPDLQTWKLDGGQWTLILLPQVHSELDERKRDERTRDSAMKVIRQIEDFGRRGDTFVGVPLSGSLRVREVPTGPDMGRTLPWLNSETPDDLILAGALELVWDDLTAQVAITASDRNLRNKARLAGLGVVHPDDL